MTGRKTLPTKERLAQELEKQAPVNGLERLVKRARAGMYDDYESPLATPQMQLVEDLRKVGLTDMVKRVMNGEFDGTREEAAAWERSADGQETFLDLLFTGRLKPDADRKCPHCGESNIEAQGTRPGEPRTGDASLCFYCVQWAIFDAELMLRKPTAEEEAELKQDRVAMFAEKMLRRGKEEQ